ncbi:MAG: bacterioferritin [Chloroflexi bacterium]|nr:bacterioferritin [Chloroflexota bacterium]
MKGDPRVIAVLNDALQAELTAISQYFVHTELCENWKYGKLHKLIRDRAIQEMKHAEKLIGRIIYLEGIPMVNPPLKMTIGKDVPLMVKNDTALEVGAVARYNKGVAVAVKAGDEGTREILEGILKDEEVHLLELEAQQTQLGQMGLENFLSVQV